MANILWSDVVGSATIADGGYVGDLLRLARAHVDEAIKNNELTQSDAGQIYTAMIPAAFQNGINFVMQAALTGEKIELTKAQTAVENENTALLQEKVKSEVKNNKIDGIIDTQLKKMKEDIALLYTDRVIKDKQAAVLGMDDVILTARNSKTGSTIYKPYYVENA